MRMKLIVNSIVELGKVHLSMMCGTLSSPQELVLEMSSQACLTKALHHGLKTKVCLLVGIHGVMDMLL